MALQFSPVHVNFGEGVDTRSDSKAVVPTKLLKAQNVVFTAPGALRTRFGWASVETNAAYRVVAKRGSERILCGERELFPANRLTKWLSGMVGIRRTPNVRTPDGVAYQCDAAIVGNIMVTATLVAPSLSFGANDTIMVIVSKVDTGEILTIRSDLFAVNTTIPRCVAVGQYVWILGLNFALTAVRGSRYDTVANSFQATANVVTAAAISGFDAAPLSSTRWALSHADTGTPDIHVKILDAAAAAVTSSTIAAVNAGNGVAITATDAEAIYVAYKNTGTGNLECSAKSVPALTALFTGSILQAAPYPTAGGNVQIVLARRSSTEAYVLWDDLSAIGSSVVKVRVIDNSGAMSSTTTYFRRLLQSKPWVYSGVARVVMGYDSGLQGTTYVQQFEPANQPQIGGIIARGYAGVPMVGATGSLPNMPQTATAGVFLGPVLTKQKLLTRVAGTSFSYVSESVGTDLCRLDHVSANRFCTAELGGLTYIAGGVLHWYDGSIVGEAGFMLRPEKPTVTAAAGGAVTAGAHQYVVIWSYTDIQGNVHRSAPSPAESITVAAGTQTLSATIQPLNMSQRDQVNADPVESHVFAEWYGTLAASPGPFHRIHAPADCPRNTVNADPLLTTANTAAADSTISQNPKLYTSGDALPNFPPPSTDCIATHQNRIVLISAEDGRIWFSKEYIVGEAPGFNEILAFALPTSERPVALASFDDKLIAWTANEIHVLAGDFPNDQGAGSTLHSQRIASDVGAIDWRSVAVTHLGAFFLSTKGIMLLTRGLQVVAAGADVDYWTDNYTECTAAFVTPDRDEVRFHMRGPKPPIATPTSQTLVLNFRAISESSPFGQWSHFNDALGDVVSAQVVGSAVYKLTAAGALYSETQVFSDNGAWITVDVETANIYPFGRQAFQRTRTATLLGTSEGQHAIEVQIAYDDEPVFSESAYFSAADLALLGREQVSHHLVQQKCSGLRMKITTYADGGSPNAGVTLSGSVLEAAQKRGSRDRNLPKEARQ